MGIRYLSPPFEPACRPPQNQQRKADAVRTSAERLRTPCQRRAIGLMPVIISRSGKCPWRTSRARRSTVCRHAC